MHPRRNILFLTPRVPFPPNTSGSIRAFRLLERLSERHNLYCASFLDSPGDAAHAIALRQWCVDVIAVPWNRCVSPRHAILNTFSDRSLACAAYDDVDMWDRLRDWSRAMKFDTVVAFSACMAPYAWSFPARRRVLDLCDMDSLAWFSAARASRFPMSAAYRAEARRLAAFESRCAMHFDATIVATRCARQLVDPEGLRRTVQVIPNGVDRPTVSLERPSSMDPIVTLVGPMNERSDANGATWFLEQVWPRVKRAVPDARLNTDCEGQTPLLDSRVAIAPMPIHPGFPDRVVEAMAIARPVVARSAVAEALEAESGRHLLSADSPVGFADRVIALLCRDAFCDQVAAAGHRFVSDYYHWPDILDHFERLVMGRPAEPACRPSFPSLIRPIRKNMEALR